jgi:hypothetical protein
LLYKRAGGGEETEAFDVATEGMASTSISTTGGGELRVQIQTSQRTPTRTPVVRVYSRPGVSPGAISNEVLGTVPARLRRQDIAPT